MLQLVAVFAVILAVTAIYRHLVEPTPEQKQVFATQEFKAGEVNASLRRSGTLLGLFWQTGTLFADDEDVWWEGMLLRRSVTLTGGTVLANDDRTLLDSVQLAVFRSDCQIVQMRIGKRRLRLAVEPDTVEFVRAALAHAAAR